MHQIFRMKQPTLILLRKTKNSQLLDHLNDPEVFQLVKTYQVSDHSSICWKHNVAILPMMKRKRF